MLDFYVPKNYYYTSELDKPSIDNETYIVHPRPKRLHLKNL